MKQFAFSSGITCRGQILVAWACTLQLTNQSRLFGGCLEIRETVGDLDRYRWIVRFFIRYVFALKKRLCVAYVLSQDNSFESKLPFNVFGSVSLTYSHKFKYCRETWWGGRKAKTDWFMQRKTKRKKYRTTKKEEKCIGCPLPKTFMHKEMAQKNFMQAKNANARTPS